MTISYEDFLDQAKRSHDELLILVCILQTEKLPLAAMHSFTDEDVPPLEAALAVLKKIITV